MSKLDGIDNTILTIRDKDEGGMFRGNVTYKVECMGLSKKSLLDVEIKHLNDIPDELFYSGRLILSVHRFDRMLEKSEINGLIRIIGNNLLKIAMNVTDIKFALNMVNEFRGKMIMVDVSGNTVNRLILSFASGVLYTYFREPTAPGQIDYETAIRLMDSIKDNRKMGSNEIDDGKIMASFGRRVRRWNGR